MAAADLKTAGSVEVEVARGKTVVFDRKRYGPGEKLAVSKDDAALLSARGFVVDAAAPEVKRVTAQDPSLSFR